MAVKYYFVMVIKYTNVFHSKALENWPKSIFWFENKPSGNPGLQGDQIVRIFAHWVIIYFRKLFGNYRSSPRFGPTLYNSLVNALPNLGRKWVGLHFFTNSSGHTERLTRKRDRHELCSNLWSGYVQCDPLC
jgi:hypothetical protein